MEPAPVSDPQDPYRSPEAEGRSRSEASSVDLFTATSAFEVGEEEKHEVRVTWSYWSGEEVYVIDDVEVARMRSFEVSGVREFNVGEEEKHKIEIRFRSLPFNTAEVYVDGKPYIRNLFPRLGVMTWTIAAVIFIPIGLMVAWFLYFGRPM